MQTTFPSANSSWPGPPRCYRCFRPQTLCFCASIPQIDNRTEVLILQHVGERFHPFNTARIVRASLRHCQLVVDHNQRFCRQPLPLRPQAALLFPSATSRTLTDLPPEQLPDQLVVVDGTWHQAKSIVRDVRQLHGLPCFRLAPDRPGQYRIRREPTAESLSTLEATVSALRVLEPETSGLQRLLDAFHGMVDRQLAARGSRSAWRHRKSKRNGSSAYPRGLFENPNRLVVAYGEATPGTAGQSEKRRPPVNWVAQRVDTGERFSCCLRPTQPLPEVALGHLRLASTDLESAVSLDEFRARWNQFLGRDDLLVVYHDRTYQLLRHTGAALPRCLVLKSIFRRLRPGFGTLEELLACEGLVPPNLTGQCRANERLEMALMLLRKIHSVGTSTA